jgi:predicted nuclease of predicted toxin-antitoxin system
LTRFLVDENLSPDLVEVANRRGYEAHHVNRRGWASLRDDQLLRRALDEDLVLVTNNWADFAPMLRRAEVHPGCIAILPSVYIAAQLRLFEVALEFIESAHPPGDLINTILYVNADESITVERT